MTHLSPGPCGGPRGGAASCIPGGGGWADLGCMYYLVYLVDRDSSCVEEVETEVWTPPRNTNPCNLIPHS